MEQENKIEAGASAVAPRAVQNTEQDNEKELETPTKLSSELHTAKQENGKEADKSVASSRFHAEEQDWEEDGKRTVKACKEPQYLKEKTNSEDEKHAETLVQSQPVEKETPNSSQTTAKLIRKSAKSKLHTKKSERTAQVQEKIVHKNEGASLAINQSSKIEEESIEHENNKEAEIAIEASSHKLQHVEQEIGRKAETTAELSSGLQTTEQVNEREIETPDASIKLCNEEKENNETNDMPVEASSKLQNMKRDTETESDKPAEASNQCQPLEDGSSISSKPRAKIVQRSTAKNKSNIKKVKNTVQAQEKVISKDEGASMGISESRSKEENMAQQNKNIEAPVETSTKLQNLAQMNKETEASPKGSGHSQTQKKIPNSLKVRAKIVKKSADKNLLNSNRGEGTQNVEEKRRKDTEVYSGRNTKDTVRKPTCDDKRYAVAPNGGDNIGNEKITLEREGKNKDSSHSRGKSAEELTSVEQNHQSRSAKGKKFKERWKECKNEENHYTTKGEGNLKKKRKFDAMEENQERNMKEKVGGLIFMCSTKTKPDCLRYQIMGVPESQKDLVLRVKPGLKLFLYDFDLKLMYGIYKSSSKGGRKLEPKAFNGAFPYQVRFKIHMDCYPLPESIFKKAMKENFITKHKFKAELSFQQVRKLAELFRPVNILAIAQPLPGDQRVQSPRRARDRGRDSDVVGREPRHYSLQDPIPRDSYPRKEDRDERRYLPTAYERDHLITSREHPPVRGVGTSRGMFLTEKEYRAYGLQGDGRNSDLPTYWEDKDRDRLRRERDVAYRDAVPSHRDYGSVGPSYLDRRDYRRDYQTYSIDVRNDYPLPGTYSEHLRRGDIMTSGDYLPAADRLSREAIGSVDRLYSTHDEYDLLRRYRVAETDSATLPVSSRYSFAGPRI